MNRMRRHVALVGVLTMAFVAVLAASAVANDNTRPVLKSPGKHKVVRPGRIILKVYDPGVSKDLRPVYVTIRPNRKLDRAGHLSNAHCDVAKRCDFLDLTPWRGHRGWWIYVNKTSFPGWWATTPGRLYWQASHTAPLCDAKGCEIVSRIGSFRVR